MTRKPRLGRSEAEVLRHVAGHSPTTVREAADHFAAARGHTKTTILNMMERLRLKGFLQRELAGGVYRYSPVQPASVTLRDLVRDFVDEMLGGSLEPFTAYLAENPKVSGAEIARLRETLALLEGERKDEAKKDEAKEKEQ